MSREPGKEEQEAAGMEKRRNSGEKNASRSYLKIWD